MVPNDDDGSEEEVDGAGSSLLLTMFVVELMGFRVPEIQEG